MPRDNSQIENMFNGTKGRFYSFTNGDILKSYMTIKSLENFQDNDTMQNQQKNKSFSVDGKYRNTSSTHGTVEVSDRIKTIGGFLNG